MLAGGSHESARPGALPMRLKLTPISELPAPGVAAIEVIACDLNWGAGRRAVRLFCGKQALRRLLRRRAQFVAVMIGAASRHIVECSEFEFIELGAQLLDFTRCAPGPIVMMPIGLKPGLREKMLTAARRRDLETAEPAGHA